MGNRGMFNVHMLWIETPHEQLSSNIYVSERGLAMATFLIACDSVPSDRAVDQLYLTSLLCHLRINTRWSNLRRRNASILTT